MFERIKGKDNFLKLMLVLISLVGIYLIIAWASYSPLDNAWSIASNATETTLNKAGSLGAWAIDLLYTIFGKVAFIVPFILAFVPIYYFVLGTSLRWDWLKFFSRLASFLALMIGLAMLSNTLFSNSAEYLSGGFIGSLFSSLLEAKLGTFGTLVVAMLFTIVGFYFCSVQTLLQLGTQLYQWVFAENPKAESSAPNPAQADEMTAKSANEESDNPEQAQQSVLQSSQSRLTDVTQLTRPKIIGLKTEEENTAGLEADNSTSAENHSTPFSVTLPNFAPPSLAEAHTEMAASSSAQATSQAVEFSAETTPFATSAEPMQILPTVSLATQPSTNLSAQAENTTDEVCLPKVHLAPKANAQTTVPIPSIMQPSLAKTPLQPQVAETFNEQEFDEEAHEAELARQFAEQEEARIRAMEERAKQQGLGQTFQQIMEKSQEMPVVQTAPVVKVAEHNGEGAHTEGKLPNQTAKANPTPYPNGYGETLIHPLLRQPTPLEKPTTPLPTIDLLQEPVRQTQQITEREILRTSQNIEQELANFGVKATVEDVLVGPVVTRYEIQPAPGTKAAKIMSLGPDLARALMFDAIRITDKVPNKPYMGIETPNAHREIVWLRDVLDSEEFRHSKAILPMALGKDVSGKPVVIDMAKTPHLLVAGQTGSGKSVGINTMILSLLYKLTPEQVRFIMVDPKMVELDIYDNIPHLLTPVVTDMKQASNALNWAVEEMERRYALLRVLSVRNIEGYNSKIDLAAEMKQPIPNPLWRPGDSMDSLPPPLEKLSYIVLIVDEFADLLMTEGKKVEEHIQRITQKARAVGIHLILATQRPSTDVITGVIKANIPSRIAFTVATQIDSRTILERGGAESLLNRGDMLYSDASSPDVMRVHGAYMSDEDAQRVADNWRARGKPDYIENIVRSNDPDDESNSVGARGVGLDPLFDEVVAYVIESNVTSISGIQRRFALGFPRAAKIIEQIEAEGIISAPDSRNKREVLAR